MYNVLSLCLSAAQMKSDKIWTRLHTLQTFLTYWPGVSLDISSISVHSHASLLCLGCTIFVCLSMRCWWWPWWYCCLHQSAPPSKSCYNCPATNNRLPEKHSHLFIALFFSCLATWFLVCYLWNLQLDYLLQAINQEDDKQSSNAIKNFYFPYSWMNKTIQRRTFL